MRAALHGVPAVSRAVKARLPPLIIVAVAIVQFLAAVGAVQQPGKHADQTGLGGVAAVFAQALYQGKALRINDGGV